MTSNMNGTEADWKRIKQIEKRIFEATAEDGAIDTVEALLSMILFNMTVVCPRCRERIAEHLQRYVPTMLATANEIVAKRRTSDEPCTRH